MAPKAVKKPADINRTSENHAGRILNLFYHAAFDDMDSLAVTPAPVSNASLKHYQTYDNLCKPSAEQLDWQSRVTIAPEVKQIVVGLYNDVIAAISDIGGISETSEDVDAFMGSLNDMVDRQVWTIFTAAAQGKSMFGPRLTKAVDQNKWFSTRFNGDIKTNNSVMTAQISRMFDNVLKLMAYNAVIYTHYCNMSWNVGLAKAFFVSNRFDTPMMLTIDSYVRERVKKPTKSKTKDASDTPAADANTTADTPADTPAAAADTPVVAAATDAPAPAANAPAAASTSSAEIDNILKNIL